MFTKEELEIFYKKTGELIKESRLRSGLTQEELAEKLGFLSHISIVNIENGKQKVQLHTLYDVAFLLNTPIQNLVPSNQEMHRTLSKGLLKEIDKEAIKQLKDSDSIEKLKAFIKFSSK